MGPSVVEKERGAALVAAVLLALAILTLAHGVLVASLGELSGSRAALRELRLRLAAQRAAERTSEWAGGAWMDSVAPFDAYLAYTDTSGPIAEEGWVRRLGAESWRAEGGAGSISSLQAWSYRLAWAMDASSRVLSLGAVVSVAPGAPVVLGGIVDAASVDAATAPLSPADCAPWQAGVTTRYSGHPVAPFGLLPDSAAPSLGLAGFTSLMAAVPVLVASSGTPGPVDAGGVCTGLLPWNWGEPDRPWRPCGSHFPLRGSTSDLVVDGGVGQGVLVVDGDLELRGGARFHGLVVASGRLTVTGGSVLEGFALSSGGFRVDPGARVSGSACWAIRALAASRDAVGGLIPVPAADLGP